MARLNEPIVSTDPLETLRKKMLRQNRELAKSNNARAQRIRDLEKDCAYMLSENLELRGRILELERQVEDSETRRIADHALAIKSKLESQLADFSALVAGLGVEPPLKRTSTQQQRRQTRPRLSFSASRPSPSQRRLRDVAREIEDLGYISENKSGPRRSMKYALPPPLCLPEQILALRSQADLVDSPELGPPPLSMFIDEDPVKIDSPCKATTETPQAPSPSRRTVESPMAFEEPLPSPVAERSWPSPATARNTVKIGEKRKLAAREDLGGFPSRQKENQMVETETEKKKKEEKKAETKNAKDVGNSERERSKGRQPLAAKSTNEHVRSPKKDGTATTKPEPPKVKSSQARARGKTKSSIPPMDEASAEEKGPSFPERPLLAILPPSSPERLPTAPNLRDKMRRPSKQLFDAVAGEGKKTNRPSRSSSDASPLPASHLPLPSPSRAAKQQSADPASCRRRSRSCRRSETVEGEAQGSDEVDVYEFASSSPPSDADDESGRPARSGSRRQTLASSSSRTPSTTTADRGGSESGQRDRRRSMMV
ncbi:hypothetical protein L249_3273 [Ophiocordyceps polyrhachis-furcata BCC 54312]|uniref:Shugoshin N-terminal coiled-coil domain-containing protein n=1 Tax=Ophiocordyceps polyrhachis-furcata BCC 54312 TaxID=1330021 RepID=A0A367LQH8_9HYPO|nr:hypothetical protein L249_3273 [Ophiocordyceps polyrhachis-furcata BCC 54312]